MSIGIKRDYRLLLDHAETLERDFGGYLSTAGLTEKNSAQRRFDDERRAFVYSLFKEGGPHGLLAPSVMADLDRIEPMAPQGDAAFDYVREQLRKHIGKATRHNGLQRFVVRWGPAASIAAVAIGYCYLKYRALSQ